MVDHLLDGDVLVFRQVGLGLDCEQEVHLPLRFGLGGKLCGGDLGLATTHYLVVHAVHREKNSG